MRQEAEKRKEKKRESAASTSGWIALALERSVTENRLLVPLLLFIVVGILSSLFHRLDFPWANDDIGAFYYYSRMPGFPYVDKPIEYPVLTGLFIQFAGAVGQSFNGYYYFSSFLLVSFSVLSTYLLIRILQARGNGLGIFVYWIFAPSMLFFLVYNWDAIAIMFVVIALYFVNRNRDHTAALFLALGFCTKFFPAIYLLPLLVRRRDPREWAKTLGIFAGVTLAVNLPFMLINFEGWYYFFSFNNERPPNPDSIWALIQGVASSLSITSINAISLLLFGAGSLVLAWKYRWRRESTVGLFLVITLLFMLTNKVFSPQYLLWLLPLYVLFPMRNRGLFYSLEISNLVVLFAILTYYSNMAENGGYLSLSNAFVVVRHVLLVGVFAYVLRSAGDFRRSRGYIPDSVSTPDQGDPRSGDANESRHRLDA